MYWGQITLAAVTAFISANLLVQRGYSNATAVLTGIIVYFGIRWLIAWIFRMRYWFNRGTRGVYSQSCGNCGKLIYRQDGDWILTCHRCGWRPGLPIIRFVTMSVPAIQFRRTVVGPGLIVVTISALLVGAGVAGILGPTSMAVNEPDIDIDGSADSGNPQPESKTTTGRNTRTIESTKQPTSTPRSKKLNRSKIELLIHEYINEERASRGLSTLSFDRDLREIARYHSENMATKDFFSHTSPDGQTMQDRYERFGYDCRVSTGGDRYATGAENIAYKFATSDAGSPELLGNNESRIAEAFVSQWMDSDGHRENILKSHWTVEGIGISLVSSATEIRIYATQNFC